MKYALALIFDWHCHFFFFPLEVHT